MDKIKIDPTKEKNVFSIIPDMEQEKKKIQGDYSLLHLGISSIVLGVAMNSFLPITPLVYIFYGIGIGSTAFHVTAKKQLKYETLLKHCNLYKGDMLPQLHEKKKTSYGYCLRFSLPPGLSSDDFKNKKKAIEQFLDRRVEIKYAHKNILLEIYEKELQRDYNFEVIETKGILELVIGHSYNGPITVNLLDGEPHMLIAGETGAGKSTVLRAILTILILTKDPNNVKLHLVDLKRGAELGIFRKCEMVNSFSKTPEEAEGRLYKILMEVERRYDLFAQYDCVDIKEYNKKFKTKKLYYQLVVIDEFSELKKEKDSLGIIERLAAMARACGIHLLISTQRPSATVINGDIKANVSVVLGLKTMNDVNSRIVIDHDGLSDLRGKGHGILKHKGKEIEIQSMNLQPYQARDLLKDTYTKKDDKNNFEPKKQKTVAGEVENFDFLKVFKGDKY